MKKNLSFQKSKKAKNDEFYTQFLDIEVEVERYREQLKGKVIFCNCDDPYESNFFLFFALNFRNYGLRKLISTCYSGSKIVGTQLSFVDDCDELITNSKAYLYILENEIEDLDGDGVVTYRDVEIYLKKHKPKILKGDEEYLAGDFRSKACIKLLEESDICCTNPPFSLFREFIFQLEAHQKKFLIIGNDNAITFKEVFPLVRDNKIWLGYNKPRPKKFRIVKDSDAKNIIEEDGVKYATMGNCGWFTNLDTVKRHESFLRGVETLYSPEKHPKYDNYDAINVDKLGDIPKDYFGVIGVPISFLEVYNPDEFELLGITDRDNNSGVRTKIYKREDSSNYSDLNRRGAIQKKGILTSTYARLLIKRRVGTL